MATSGCKWNWGHIEVLVCVYSVMCVCVCVCGVWLHVVCGCMHVWCDCVCVCTWMHLFWSVTMIYEHTLSALGQSKKSGWFSNLSLRIFNKTVIHCTDLFCCTQVPFYSLTKWRGHKCTIPQTKMNSTPAYSNTHTILSIQRNWNECLQVHSHTMVRELPQRVLSFLHKNSMLEC